MVADRECYRSSDGRHEIVRNDITEFCRHCFIVPRTVMDTPFDEVVVTPMSSTEPSSPSRTRAIKVVKPIKTERRVNVMVELAERDYGWTCFYCEHELVDPTTNTFTQHLWAPTIDHLIPRSIGGTNKIDNLVLACLDCNNRKADGASYLVKVIKRLRRERRDLEADKERAIKFIEHLKWELFDAGLGEMPADRVLAKDLWKPSKHWRRPRPKISEIELYIELGERAVANLRAENVGPVPTRAASIAGRGRLLVRREVTS